MRKLEKIREKINRTISPDITVCEERGCIVLYGELDNWEDVVRAGKLAVSKSFLGVVNRIKLKGHSPKMYTTYFTPTFSKHQGTLCQGVMLHITDRGTFLPVKTGWTMLETIRTASDAFRVNPPYHEGGKVMLDLNTGTDAVSKHQWSLSEQWNKLEEDSLAFSKMREQYLLY